MVKELWRRYMILAQTVIRGITTLEMLVNCLPTPCAVTYIPTDAARSEDGDSSVISDDQYI
jgi:hypothetical protein